MGIKRLSSLMFIAIFFLIISCKEEELVLLCNGNDCSWFDVEIVEDSFKRVGQGDCVEQRSLLYPDARIFQCGEFKR